MRKASRRVSQLYDLALARSGLSINQRGILAEIGRSAPLTVGKLAEALVMDPGALAHNLKPLERDGLTCAHVDPKDRRQRLITLTAAGRAKLAETDGLWAERTLVSADFMSAFHAALQDGKSDAGLRADI
jgi:DNA-binding MarR family transcriptional regulator